GNVNEALAAFEKYKDVLNKKFSKADRDAIFNALASVKYDDWAHYTLSAGTSENHTSLDGYYSHDGTLAKVDLSANYHEGQYTSAGVSL
ncbi:colicin-like pore-forming protein, partial [Escherichia coli]|nr:colicin-like pore-forming protein [Escherichia coli]